MFTRKIAALLTIMGFIMLSACALAETPNKARAIAAYNRGADAMAEGNRTRAISEYRSAIYYDPSLIESYNNLADILAGESRYDEAIQLCQQGLALQPDAPLLHRNLGILYEKQGRMKEAIASYKAYLAKTEKPDPPVAAVVETYERYRLSAGNAPDYFSALQTQAKNQGLRWQPAEMPLSVFVSPAESGRPFALSAIDRALADWSRSVGPALRFRKTPEARLANIIIRLQPGALAAPHQSIGHTEFSWRRDAQERRPQPRQVTIHLNTGTPEEDRRLSLQAKEAFLYRFALHELGHAIGLWGHSPDPADIMFTHPIAEGLSQRDIRTARMYYGPEALSTKPDAP